MKFIIDNSAAIPKAVDMEDIVDFGRRDNRIDLYHKNSYDYTIWEYETNEDAVVAFDKLYKLFEVLEI